MPDPFTCDDEMHALDKRIASAWAALAGARAASQHSPNGDTAAIEAMCERTIDDLLDQRTEMTRAVRTG